MWGPELMGYTHRVPALFDQGSVVDDQHGTTTTYERLGLLDESGLESL